MDVPAAASAAASRADEPCPPDATVSCVTADDGTALHVRCEWRHGERSFDALVVAFPRRRTRPSPPGARRTCASHPTRRTPTGTSARRRSRRWTPPPLRLLLATSTSDRDGDDDRAVFRWTWHELRPAGFRRRSWRERRRAPANPGPARVDAPRKGAKRVGALTLRAASALSPVRALLRCLVASLLALRRKHAHEASADDLSPRSTTRTANSARWRTLRRRAMEANAVRPRRQSWRRSIRHTLLYSGVRRSKPLLSRIFPAPLK